MAAEDGFDADASEPGGDIRLFFALWPAAGVRAGIRRSAREAVRHAGGKPVPSANYHLTLAFLGAQPRSSIPAITAAVAQVKPPAGRLVLARVGCFPRARVLWFGPERTPRALAQFVRSLWAALGEAGVSGERRPFHAHVTLARKVGRTPAAAVRPVNWPYAGFALVESELGGHHSRYRVLSQWPPPGL